MLGGVLIALSALLSLGMSSLQGAIPGLPFDITQVLFYVGAVILAVGWGRAGSVTARRPLGTGAIIALAVWQVVLTPLLWELSGAAGVDGSGGGDASATMMVAMTMNAISLALAIIAVAQIGRAGVVPRPWNWAPLWVLVVVVAPQLVLGVIGVAGGMSDPTWAFGLFSLAALLSATAVAALGVLAIVLAVRPAPASTVVYSPGS